MSEELKKEWRGQFEDEFPFLDELRAYGTKKNIIDFIISLLAKQQEEFVKIVKIHNAILKSMIDEVKDRNGLPYCKNCGLSEEDLLADIKSKLKI